MNKYDFIKSKIKQDFDEDLWFEIEQRLRKKCMKVFAFWFIESKDVNVGELTQEEIEDFIKEWISDQKHSSEYSKKYKYEKEDRIIKCNECVFAEKLIDKDAFYCLQYVKEKDSEGNCNEEPDDKSSEFFGELYEFLELLK